MSNIQLTTLIMGLLNFPLALTVWTMLYRRTRVIPLRLWVVGALAMGLGVSGFGQRDFLPDWITFELSYGLMSLSLLLRAGALRMDQGRATRWVALLSVWATGMLAYSALLHTGFRPQALPLGAAFFVAGTAFFAFEAWRAGRQAASRSGMMLACVEAFFGLLLLLRLLATVAGWVPMRPFIPEWHGYALALTGVVAVVYANLGYVGLVLDRTKSRERLAREAQLAETVRREEAESNAEQLRTLMAERDRLLHVLAHEIRQPLHNAGGALAAACEVLQTPDADGPGRATQRLQRAQAVLDQMRAVLDNTLAATSLMARREPLGVHDVDLDTLVELTLGDIPEASRGRIVVERSTDLRSCELESTLVRLALRNLLRNALSHAGKDARVALRIEERRHPPMLVLAVCDDGPGLPSGPQTFAPRGLGLSIVRQVMVAHGGYLVLQAQTPKGLRAVMEFPLPAEEDAMAAPPFAVAAAARAA